MDQNDKTEKQFEEAIRLCRDVYLKKLGDYGSSWRILRSPSITDQIFIKASRIRSIDSKGEQKIDEGITPEYIGIVNYAVIALIQLELGDSTDGEITPEQAEKLYDKHIRAARDLMFLKNHDYGEVWREMRLSSLTDIILMRIKRIKQIEDNDGKTLVSEGVGSNFMDIINYAVFALIRIRESGAS